jgi:hypothetical protein
VGTFKTLEQYEGSTISLHGYGATGAYAPGPEEEQNPLPGSTEELQAMSRQKIKETVRLLTGHKTLTYLLHGAEANQ